MSKQGFTPGPWLQEPGDTIICIRANEANDSYRIADVGGMPYWARYTDTDLANARLIAAAPELYEALEAVKAKYDFGDTLPDDHPIAMVRAALTKATGGA